MLIKRRDASRQFVRCDLDEPAPRLGDVTEDNLSEMISHRSGPKASYGVAAFRLKISLVLESRQKVVVSGGSMPQQRQRGSSRRQTSSRPAYTHPDTHTRKTYTSTRTVVSPSLFPFLLSPLPSLTTNHPHPSFASHPPLSAQTPHGLADPRRPPQPRPHHSPLGALIRLRSLMACTYETVTHILT